MGNADRSNWEDGVGRTPGCMCLYCGGRFNWQYERYLGASGDPNSMHYNLRHMRPIPEGFVQLLTDPRGPAVPVGCIGNAPAMYGIQPVGKVYAKTDYNCCVCGERNEYAAANFGSKYKCYKCRT